MSRYAILSDIHGNLFALDEVINDFDDIDHIILLGDLIDYGMQVNSQKSIQSLLKSIEEDMRKRNFSIRWLQSRKKLRRMK